MADTGLSTSNSKSSNGIGEHMNIGGIAHERLDNGFIRQVERAPCNYTEDYANAQSTTEAMSYLRLALIEREMGFDALAQARVLELGPGAGVMMNVMRRHCRSVDGFDLAPTKFATIDDTEAKRRSWDLLVACDVLEHFPNVESLFDYQFDWAYISTPCRPEAIDWNELTGWRHFKPNEHLWYFSLEELRAWFDARGCEVRYAGHAEDLIRARWDRSKGNISSFVIKRKT